MPKRLNIQECRKAAQSRGGECLSDTYVNAKTKLKWCCSKGHEWSARFDSIRQGKWCPQCSGNVKVGIQKCQDIAVKCGGLCLSTTYTNRNTKLRWSCSVGHTWEATHNSVRRGNWCPHCAGLARRTLGECQEIARSREGECLSTEYVNNRTRMLWRCKQGHEWKAAFGNVSNQGQWCSQCAGLVRHTIEYCQEIAEFRGGSCLSETYINNRTKIKWRCEKSHEWSATFDSILNCNSWCPKCKIWKTEEKCREIFQTLTGYEWISCKPQWNMGTRNRPLELDGYCEKLKAAFEYNGRQHYEHVPFFHRTPDGLRIQQERDQMTRDNCKANGVTLIEIPYDTPDLEHFIIQQLARVEF